MSKFEVKVCKIDKVTKHPNADSLYVVNIGDYQTITNRADREVGELVAYIPEGSVLPEYILKRLEMWDDINNKGKLAGSNGNRLKPLKLRGLLSQGVMYPVETTEVPSVQTQYAPIAVYEGLDVAQHLGVIKYEPPIPVHMQGELWNAYGSTISYEIENIKKYPDVLLDGEKIAVTEKAHGTFCCIGHIPETGSFIVHSKGLGGDGLAFKINDTNVHNLYVRAFHAIKDKFGTLRASYQVWQSTPLYFLGEIFGTGVQDLAYGLKEPTFRVFDIFIGAPGFGRYMDYDEKTSLCDALGIAMVPVLYVGAYSKDKVLELTKGKETVSGQQLHIREGVVITPTQERRDNPIGRVILKSISEDYLLRKNKNATEYQ